MSKGTVKPVALAVSANTPPEAAPARRAGVRWRASPPLGRDGQRYIERLLMALFLCFLLPGIASSESAEALEQRVHELIESGDYDTALAEGVDAVTRHPDSPGLLHEVGRAAFRGDRYHLAIYYFNRSLLFRPNYGATLLYLGWAQRRANLSEEARETFHHVRAGSHRQSGSVRGAAIAALKQLGPEPPLHKRGRRQSQQRQGFAVAAPYAALLEYGGDTPKAGGQTYQLDLRAGLLGRGYVEFSEAWTSVETLPDYPDYEVLEHRIGLAGFVAPRWLLKGKYALLDADYEGGGTGHFAALGVDWLRRGRLHGGVTGSFADYPDGDVSQLMPRLTWRGKRFELATTLSLQQWAPMEGEDKFLGLVRQDLLIPLPRGDGISVGYAAGESRYGHAGFGDVLYSLPDKQTGSVYLRYARPLYPFMLSLKTSIDTFKTDEDHESYHSTAHTVSLGYLSRTARAPLAAHESPWTLAFGVGTRQNSAKLTMDAADPLVTDLVGPLTFTDESGDYTSIYFYDLETGLDAREMEGDDRGLCPYVELRRLVRPPEASLGFSFYGRYTFAPLSYEFEAEAAGYQRVWESYVDLYTGAEFGGGRGIFATYNATQQGRFDLNLHELALGVELDLRLLSELRLAAGCGLLVGLADWSASDSTQWTEEGDDTVLDWVDRHDAGQELIVGATVDLRLRWAPSADSPWFVELGGGYAWYDDLEIDRSPIAAALDLASATGTIGIGLR